jgi:RsiW-degrading membrane proteinase PrsW (M82 family)
MHRPTAIRAGLLQLACVAVLSIVLAVALGHHFFEDNGFWAGPIAWLVCAAVTGTVLKLSLSSVLIGAVFAGIPSGILTVLGLHWEGALLAVVVFALWCGRLAVDPDLIEELV